MDRLIHWAFVARQSSASMKIHPIKKTGMVLLCIYSMVDLLIPIHLLPFLCGGGVLRYPVPKWLLFC